MEYTDKDDITTYQAIKSLVGGELHTDLNGIIHYLGGQTPPTNAEIDAKVVELKAEYDSQEYARKREVEYPSIQECVHAILDDTLDALQAKRASVKLKYPKGG